MSLLEAFFYGLVQGFTEFLPISSSGHLVLLGYFIPLKPEKVVFYALVVHLGTLCSVLTIYREKLLQIIKDITFYPVKRKYTDSVQMGVGVILATAVTVVVALFFKETFESFFENKLVVGASFLCVGALLFFVRKLKGHKIKVTALQALVIGLLQALAIIPGVSRSGLTIAGGLLCGLNRKLAVEFSFLLSIPTILGASLFVFFERQDFFRKEIVELIVSFASAYIFGIVALNMVMRFVETGRLMIFSYYLWVMGFLVVSVETL